MRIATGNRGGSRGQHPPATVASAKVLRHRTAKTPDVTSKDLTSRPFNWKCPHPQPAAVADADYRFVELEKRTTEKREI